MPMIRRRTRAPRRGRAGGGTRSFFSVPTERPNPGGRGDGDDGAGAGATKKEPEEANPAPPPSFAKLTKQQRKLKKPCIPRPNVD